MNTCQHTLCTCEVPTGKTYCSEACNKHQTDKASGKCACAHPACNRQTRPSAG